MLWSGLGKSGEVRAATYAKEAGGMTLEMTKGGSWLDDLKLFEGGVNSIGRDAAYTIWEQASRSVAEQARAAAQGPVAEARWWGKTAGSDTRLRCRVTVMLWTALCSI